MKKVSFFSCVAAALSIGFTACNSDGNSTAATDTATTTNTTTETTSADAPAAGNTTTSSTNYAAMADTFNTGNTEGRYLDARTGKAIKISVDPQTGRRTDATTGEPVWRYVDSRTWNVYGGESWEPSGEARMEGGKLMYRGDGDKWMTYDNRWSADDETMMKEWKSKDGKFKDGDIKVKTEKDGDMKIKTKDGEKIKVDEDGVRVKKDSSK
jgi:hypothetical protein